MAEKEPMRPSNGVLLPLDEFVEAIVVKTSDRLLRQHRKDCDPENREERISKLETSALRHTAFMAGVVAAVTLVAHLVAYAITR